jgi:hypothetical protein
MLKCHGILLIQEQQNKREKTILKKKQGQKKLKTNLPHSHKQDQHLQGNSKSLLKN